MSRWWRAYDEAVDDPKLGALSDRQHRAWFNLCCITSQNKGKLPPIAAVAFKLRITIEKAKALVAELVALKLFDIDQETGDVAPHNWSGRQFQSDVSTERVKRFRERRGNVSSTVSETPPETEADTEQKQISSLRSDSARKRGTRLPDDWRPGDEDWIEANKRLGGNAGAQEELLKFHDYWKAQPGQRGVKLDWDATWRNWIRNAKGPRNEQANRTVRPYSPAGSPPTGDDAVVAGMARALERRREARAAADGNGEFPGRGNSAGGTDAEHGATAGDERAHRQLALIPGGNVGQ